MLLTFSDTTGDQEVVIDILPQRRSKRLAHLVERSGHLKFCNAMPIKAERDLLSAITSEPMTKTPATLAKQIERSMRRAANDCFLYQNEHCALFENDLEHICPRNDKDRKKKLAEFAAQYGFRLRFYHKGLFAIFGKRIPSAVNGAEPFWLAVACSASSAK